MVIVVALHRVDYQIFLEFGYMCVGLHLYLFCWESCEINISCQCCIEAI